MMSPWKLLSIFAIACSLIFPISGCGKELPQKTKEPITFKGIPLGKPGVKDALKKMCSDNTNNNNEYSDKSACSFEKERTLIWLTYGILGNSLGWITLSSDGALMQAEIKGSKQAMLALADALTAKYGNPAKKKDQVENGFGTKFDKDIFVWVDNQGSQITVESIHSKVDEGRVIIESAASVAAQVAAEMLLKEAAKSNL